MLRKILTTVQILIIAHNSEAAVSNKDALRRSIGEMTGNIISKYFNALCIGIITENNRDVINVIPNSIFTYRIHVGWNSTISGLEESDTLDYKTLDDDTRKFESLLIESLNEGCSIYVIQASNPTAVIHCFARASRRASFRANRKYLYLPFFDDATEDEYMEDIFSMKEMDYMPDLVIARIVNHQSENKEVKSGKLFTETIPEKLYFNEEKKNVNCKNDPEAEFKIELVTHRFVGSNSSEQVLLDTWLQGGCFSEAADLFPDKISNVEGKELTLITWLYPPFIILDLDAKPPLHDGIEFRVVLEFLRSINARFRVTTDPDNYWGDVFDNGTGNGVLGYVAMDKADIGFLAFYSCPRCFKVAEFPTSHMQSSVTMVTPRPKPLPGWMVPLMPFSSAMWGVVGLSLVGATYTLYKLQNFVDKCLGQPGDRVNPFSQLDYTALRTYAMLVNQAPRFAWNSEIPRHVPARHFVGWFQFFGEVMSDTYNAGLASVLANPRYEPPIEEIEDLADRNVIWAGNHYAWIWALEEDDQPVFRKITSNFRCLTNEQMNEIGQKSRDMAFVMERLQGGHFTTESHINEETVRHRRVMRGTLYWSHLHILFRKGSPYIQHFNTLVSRIRDAGLPFYWEGDVIRKYMSERLQVQITSSRILHDNDGPTKLKLAELQGVFFLLVLGEVVALVAFLAEIVMGKNKKKKNKGNDKTLQRK